MAEEETKQSQHAAQAKLPSNCWSDVLDGLSALSDVLKSSRCDRIVSCRNYNSMIFLIIILMCSITLQSLLWCKSILHFAFVILDCTVLFFWKHVGNPLYISICCEVQECSFMHVFEFYAFIYLPTSTIQLKLICKFFLSQSCSSVHSSIFTFLHLKMLPIHIHSIISIFVVINLFYDIKLNQCYCGIHIVPTTADMNVCSNVPPGGKVVNGG